MSTLTDAEKEFLRLLAEATKATGVSINGCGCCGSPFLDTEKQPDGTYTVWVTGQVEFEPNF